MRTLTPRHLQHHATQSACTRSPSVGRVALHICAQRGIGLGPVRVVSGQGLQISCIHIIQYSPAHACMHAHTHTHARTHVHNAYTRTHHGLSRRQSSKSHPLSYSPGPTATERTGGRGTCEPRTLAHPRGTIVTADSRPPPAR